MLPHENEPLAPEVVPALLLQHLDSRTHHLVFRRADHDLAPSQRIGPQLPPVPLLEPLFHRREQGGPARIRVGLSIVLRALAIHFIQARQHHRRKDLA